MLCRDTRDVRTQAKACLLLSRYYKEQGELGKAEALYQRVLATARPLQAHEMEADACSGLGVCPGFWPTTA